MSSESSADELTCQLTGWGGYPVVDARLLRSENLEAIARKAALSRGLGRSYGDAALPPSRDEAVAATSLANRVLHYDDDRAVLRAEAGLTLDTICKIFLPRCRFTPVTPGTRYVTLGGMVAADVHGKNHHVAGSIGEHVRALRMMSADGRLLDVDEESHPELFRSTLGGMGLTGHILEVELGLEKTPSQWVRARTQRLRGLENMVLRLREASAESPFTVLWADCFGGRGMPDRGILIQGRWATRDEAPGPFVPRRRALSIPFRLPGWALNRYLARAFNRLQFWRHAARTEEFTTHPYSFFFPLDGVRNWNRLYGRRGFIQYQCVLPESGGTAAVRRFFEAFAACGGISYLCVIKDCGAQGKGLLSFPLSGTSIALDMPLRLERTRALVDALNERVIAEGGRVYLAKDLLTRPEHFRAMEPRLERFERIRETWDPDRRIRSAQSVRLLGDSS